jgi:hypothetical protein
MDGRHRKAFAQRIKHLGQGAVQFEERRPAFDERGVQRVERFAEKGRLSRREIFSPKYVGFVHIHRQHPTRCRGGD